MNSERNSTILRKVYMFLSWKAEDLKGLSHETDLALDDLYG